jgi:hypothetical protein
VKKASNLLIFSFFCFFLLILKCEDESDVVQLPPSMSLINYWAPAAASGAAPLLGVPERTRHGGGIRTGLEGANDGPTQSEADKNSILRQQISQQVKEILCLVGGVVKNNNFCKR